MGGSDPEGQTKRLGNLLLWSTDRQIEVVFFGPAYNDVDTINNFRQNKRFNVHVAPDNIPAIMSKCSYAVSGAGGMLYELAFLGVPAVAVVLAENQNLIAKAFEDMAISINLGYYKQFSNEHFFCETISMLDSDKHSIEQMSEKCIKIIDGKGVDRLVSDIIKWVKKNEIFSGRDKSRVQ